MNCFPAYFRPNDLCQVCKHRDTGICKGCTRNPEPKRDGFEKEA